MKYKLYMDRDILNALRTGLLDKAHIYTLPEHVLADTIALNTWGTNVIEGNTLTLKEDTQFVVEGKSVGGKTVRDVMETIQHN